MKHFSLLTKEVLKDLNLSKVKTTKKIEFYNIESAFDIETTSIIKDGEKIAFMYIWQLGIVLDN